MKVSTNTFVILCGLVIALSGTAITARLLQASFSDVAPGQYYSDAVDSMSRRGIISGYEDGFFGVGDYVTREQLATILQRYEQKVVVPMRQQLNQIRMSLGMGFCGDGMQQTGEECDDGNNVDGDGCNAGCTTEPACEGGYDLGEQFVAPDGCNVCTCTSFGIACTEKACATPEKCFTSAECPSGLYCSVDDGDCRYPCPAGAQCIAPCAGICITDISSQGQQPATQPSYVCGNGICEAGEMGEEVFCPVDCMAGPRCGNGICEQGEADDFDQLGTCSLDCGG